MPDGAWNGADLGEEVRSATTAQAASHLDQAGGAVGWIMQLALLLAVIVVLGVLAWYALRWWRARQASEDESDAIGLASGAEFLGARTTSRGVVLICPGTPAGRICVKLLRLLTASGLGNHIAAVLFLNFDAEDQQEVARLLPAEYHDRTVLSESALFPGGFKTAPRDEIYDDAWAWRPEVERSVAELIDVLDESGVEPTEFVVLGSGGSSGFLGPVAVKLLRRQFESAESLVVLPHPRHTKLRQRFSELTADYRSVAGVQDFIVMDTCRDAWNEERSEDEVDSGLVHLIAGALAANQSSKAATRLNNLFRLTFPADGGYASFRVATTSTRADWNKRRRRWEVPWTNAYKQTALALKMAQDVKRQAVSAPLGEPGTVQFDIVNANVVPADLRRLGSVVDHYLSGVHLPSNAPWPVDPERDYERRYATICSSNGRRPKMVVTVVSFESMVREIEEKYDGYVAWTTPRAPKQEHLFDKLLEAADGASAEQKRLPEPQPNGVVTPPDETTEVPVAAPTSEQRLSTEERRAIVQQRVESGEFRSAKHEAERLRVSPATIRADLAWLGYEFDHATQEWRKAE